MARRNPSQSDPDDNDESLFGFEIPFGARRSEPDDGEADSGPTAPAPADVLAALRSVTELLGGRASVRELGRMLAGEPDRAPANDAPEQTAARSRDEIRREKERALDTCWIPPGTPIAVRGVVLPDGMVYVRGERVTGVKLAEEPSLIDARAAVSPASGTATNLGYYGYHLRYTDLQPGERHAYLQWLAGGRVGTTNERALTLFLCGIERRLLLSEDVSAAERERLVDELRRLIETYPASWVMRHNARSLLQRLHLDDIVAGKRLPDFRTIVRIERNPYSMPLSLAAHLSLCASKSQPLTAEAAAAWMIHQPERPSRIALERVPGEFFDLFVQRFPESFPKSLKVTATRRPLHLSYSPTNDSIGGRGSHLKLPPGMALFEISVRGFNRLWELAETCLRDLDSYSRRVGSGAIDPGQLSVVATLPGSLRQSREIARLFLSHWNDRVSSGTPIAAPLAELDAWWNATPARLPDPKKLGTQVSSVPLRRAEGAVLAELLASAGILLEPDPRALGTTGVWLKPDDSVLLARGSDTQIGGVGSPPDGSLPRARRLLEMLAAVAGDAPIAHESNAALATIASRLPDTRRLSPDRRVLLLTFLRQPGARRRLNKAPVDGLAESETAIVARALILAAQTGAGGKTIAPDRVKTLSVLFAALGQSDTELYALLHRAQTEDDFLAGAVGEKLVDETNLAGAKSVGKGKIRPGQTPPASDESGLGLDRERIRQREADSARVAELLADVFTDDEPAAPTVNSPTSPATPAPATPAAPPGGRLDSRHAAFLRALLGKETWSRPDAEAKAKECGLLLGGAIDTINEIALDTEDDPAIEDDGDQISIEKTISSALLEG